MVSLRTFPFTALVATAALLSWLPAAGQGKSGETQPQIGPRSETAGGAYAPKPRDRAPVLSGRATFGRGGAVRIVLLRWPPPGEKADLKLRVRFVNEGEENFLMQPSDAWAVRTEKGARIPALRPGARAVQTGTGETITLSPHASTDLDLELSEPPRQAIVSLEYQSAQLGQIVEARAPYLEPFARLVAPPVFPSAALEAGARERVRLSVLVGADGRTEDVFVLSPPADKDLYGFREAAAQAVRSWVFDPAMENKEPQRGLLEQTFVFSDGRATRAVIGLPVVETALRLSRLLPDSYPNVVALPKENGFLVSEGARATEDRRRARAFLLRFGERALGRSTWISVAALALQTRTTPAGCNCTDWASDEKSPQDLLAVILPGLGVEPAELVTLAPQGDSLVPSGLPEPPTAGRWRREAIRRLLRSTLLSAAGGAGTEKEEPARVTEEDLVRLQEPLLVAGDVRPPEKVVDVMPVYPESARMNRIEGKVILEAVIDTRGEVSDLRVLRSIPELDQSAMDAVCCWKYRPATKNGKPVSVYFTIIVEYNLKKT